jgi:GGDEF domain-containing protein
VGGGRQKVLTNSDRYNPYVLEQELVAIAVQAVKDTPGVARVDPTKAERMAHRVLARICEPLPESPGPEFIEASGGLAMAARDDDAIERAGLAMLASKRAGRAQLIIA